MIHTPGRWQRLLLVISLLALSASFLTGCQSKLSNQQEQACPKSDQPQITTLTPTHASRASLYFTSAQDLYAVNAGNGAFRWCSRLVETGIGAAEGFTYVVLTSLTFNEGRLFVDSFDGNTDVFSGANGSLVWQYPAEMGGDWNPIVRDNQVYAGDSILFALDTQNGNILWKYAIKEANGTVPPSNSSFLPSMTNPVVSDGTVYFIASDYDNQTGITSDHLVALNAKTGKELWMVPPQSSTGNNFGFGLLVGDGKVFLLDNGPVTAFDAHTGQRLWQWSEPKNQYTLLAAANHVLYVAEQTQYTNRQATNHPRLYALDMATGQPRWSIPAVDDSSEMRVLATNDLLYLAVPGDMYAYRSQDGSVFWHTSMPDLNPGITGPVLLDGELYLGAAGSNFAKPLDFHALNAQTGVENWYASVPGDMVRGPMDVAVG